LQILGLAAVAAIQQTVVLVVLAVLELYLLLYQHLFIQEQRQARLL
jgi:hypothetical protein